MLSGRSERLARFGSGFQQRVHLLMKDVSHVRGITLLASRRARAQCMNMDSVDNGMMRRPSVSAYEGGGECSLRRVSNGYH